MIRQKILFFETLSRQKTSTKQSTSTKKEVINMNPVEIVENQDLSEILDNNNAEQSRVDKTNLQRKPTEQFQDYIKISDKQKVKPKIVNRTKLNVISQNPIEVHQIEDLSETFGSLATAETNNQPEIDRQILEKAKKNSNDNRLEKQVIAEIDRPEDLFEFSENIANSRIDKTIFEKQLEDFIQTTERQNVWKEVIDMNSVEFVENENLTEILDNKYAEQSRVDKMNLQRKPTEQFQDYIKISDKQNVKPKIIKRTKLNVTFQNPIEVHQIEDLSETFGSLATIETNNQPENDRQILEKPKKNSNDNQLEKKVIAEIDRPVDLYEFSENIANSRIDKAIFERQLEDFIKTERQNKNSDSVEQIRNRIVPGRLYQTEDYNDLSENINTENLQRELTKHIENYTKTLEREKKNHKNAGRTEAINIYEEPMETDQTGDLIEHFGNIDNSRINRIHLQGQLSSHLENYTKTLEKQKVIRKKTETEQTEELSEISEQPVSSNESSLQRQLSVHIENYNRTLERLKKNTLNDNRTMDKVVDEHFWETVEIRNKSETESFNMEKPHETERIRSINQLETNDEFIETQYKFNTKINDNENKNDEIINQLRPRRPNQPITTTLDAKTKREHFQLSRTSGMYSYQTTSISDVLDIYTDPSRFNDYISLTDDTDDDQNTKTAFIIRELIDTEKSYVEALKQALLYKECLNKYLPDNIKESVIKDIFCNIDEIYERSQKFLQILKRRNDISNVNAAFIKCESMLDLYIDYIRNKSTSDATYDKYKLLIKKKQEKLQNPLDLFSYLQKPLTRFGKYVLFLEHMEKDLIKRKQVQDATYVRSNIDKIKRAMRKANDYLIIDIIKKCPNNLNLTAQGSFILRETFVLHKPLPVPEVVACLFENVVVFTLPDEHSQDLLYMKHIFLQDLKLNYCVDSKVTFGFERNTGDKRVDATAGQFVLEASNEDIKKRWIEIVERMLWEQLKQARAESLKRESMALYSDKAVEYIQNCSKFDLLFKQSAISQNPIISCLIEEIVL